MLVLASVGSVEKTSGYFYKQALKQALLISQSFILNMERTLNFLKCIETRVKIKGQ